MYMIFLQYQHPMGKYNLVISGSKLIDELPLLSLCQLCRLNLMSHNLVSSSPVSLLLNFVLIQSGYGTLVLYICGNNKYC